MPTATLLLSLLSAFCFLQNAHDRPVVEAAPDWASPPAAIADDYPPLALLLGIEATVRLSCVGGADGRVRACHAEGPAGDLGFEGRAAVIVERGRGRPRLEDGRPVDFSFQISVPFAVAGEEAVQRYQGPEPSQRTLRLLGDRMIYGRGEEGLWWSFSLDDLSHRERTLVRPILREAFRDYHQAWWEGLVLGMARRSSEEIENDINWGREADSLRPGEGVDDPVYDQLNLVEIRVRDRARSIYCARHACPQP